MAKINSSHKKYLLKRHAETTNLPPQDAIATRWENAHSQANVNSKAWSISGDSHKGEKIA